MVLSTGGPGARHRTRLMASTRQIGNGSPVPPPMRHPVFACSIRSCGARSSIPDGGYVRDWVPELAQPPAGVIHQPGTATPLGPRRRSRGTRQQLSGADHESREGTRARSSLCEGTRCV